MKLEIDKKARYIIDTLYKHGYEAYVVGGCVRDLAMNKLFNTQAIVNDWDICTNAKPEDVLRVFRGEEKLEVIETGIKHGTVTIMIGNGVIGEAGDDLEGFEVTTYRIDGEYGDGRRPDSVEFTSSLELDLSRRDFTINALAYNDREGLRGELQDLESKILKCVGDPFQRFNEDALRILRAMRFKARLGYDISTSTSKAMFSLKGNLSAVSNERKASELCKILLGKFKCSVLTDYKNILFVVIPDLEDTDGFDQYNKNHMYDVYKHTIKALEALGDCNDIKVLLALLLHDIGKPKTFHYDDIDEQGHFFNHAFEGSIMAEKILKELKFSTDIVHDVCELVQYHDSAALTKPSIKRMLNKVGQQQMERLIIIRRADILGQSEYNREAKLEEINKTGRLLNEIIEQAQVFSLKDLAINGRGLIAIGYKPGKGLGAVLESLLELVINEEISNTEQELVDYAKKHLENQ